MTTRPRNLIIHFRTIIIFPVESSLKFLTEGIASRVEKERLFSPNGEQSGYREKDKAIFHVPHVGISHAPKICGSHPEHSLPTSSQRHPLSGNSLVSISALC